MKVTFWQSKHRKGQPETRKRKVLGFDKESSRTKVNNWNNVKRKREACTKGKRKWEKVKKKKKKWKSRKKEWERKYEREPEK